MTYIMLIRQVNFSIKNVVKVLLLTVTLAMREHNQKIQFQFSFHVMPKAASNCHHMQLANMKVHIPLRKYEVIITKHLIHGTHNTSHMDNIHKGLKTQLDVCMQIKNYSTSTYNFLIIIYENVIKLLLFHCCNVIYFLKNF